MRAAQIPVAPVELVGRQWVVLRCPYCGRRHYHGAGGGANPRDYLGHRVAHCTRPESGPGYVPGGGKTRHSKLGHVPVCSQGG